MRELVVTPEARTSNGGRVRSAATVTWPDGRAQQVWVEVAEAHEHLLVDDADAWVLATVHAAMSVQAPLRIHGPVSPSLLANLEEYQAAFAGWTARERWPGSAVYQQVPIHVDELEERARPSREVLCSFSGGVDSTFTLARHVRGQAGHATRTVAAAVMAGGFDIPVDDVDTIASAVARARRITDDLGVALIEVRSNLRTLDLPWPDVFPGAVLATLRMLGRDVGGGMVSTGRRWSWLDLPDDGSSPAWDWALGSDSFAAIHDGAAFDRSDKVAYLADWEVGRANVRVCWAGARLDRNCGRCRKCVGTYLLFRCHGIATDCFDDPPPDEDLADLVTLRRPGWTIAARYGESLLEAARANGIDEPWVAALARSLFRDRRLDDLERVGRAVRQGRARLEDRRRRSATAPEPPVP